MGCTSSAPSTFDATSSTADGRLESGCADEELEKEIAELEEIKKQQTERVLPASDIVVTSIDSSNESTVSTAANEVQIIDMEFEPPPPFKENDPVKIPTNELIVQKSSIEPHKQFLPSPSSLLVDAKPDVETIVEDLEEEETTIEELVIDTGQEQLDQGDNEDQEEQQRPTRWEALADVASELPPKMTVDPLTGQIYSLSKRD